MSEIEVNQIPKMLLNIHLMDLYNYFQNYESYKICQKQKEKNDSEKSIGFYFKNQHLNKIFRIYT